MNLTTWELKKILNRTTAKIALLLAIAYALFMGCYNGFQNLSYSDGNGKTINSGTVETQLQQEWANKWKGDLTEEKLTAVKRQFDTAFSPENQTTHSDGSIGPTSEAWERYVRPISDITKILRNTFGLIPQYSSYYDYNSVPADMFANYYAEREKIVSDYLEAQIPNNEDRDFFIKQNSQVKTPFTYDWINGQSTYLQFFNTVPLFATLFLCIALAPLFAGEYQQKAASILLCTKLGRKKLAWAKIKAAIMLSVGTYLLCTGIYFICQLIFVGTGGLDCPIQLIKPIATAPITIGQAELFAFLLGLLNCVAMIALTIMLSAKLPSSFPVIVISLLVLFLPMMLIGMLPTWLLNIVNLLPFSSDYSELFRTNLYHLFNFRIWSPNMMLLSSAIISLACIPTAKLCYVKKQA